MTGSGKLICLKDFKYVISRIYNLEYSDLLCVSGVKDWKVSAMQVEQEPGCSLKRTLG